MTEDGTFHRATLRTRWLEHVGRTLQPSQRAGAVTRFGAGVDRLQDEDDLTLARLDDGAAGGRKPLPLRVDAFAVERT